MARKRKVYEFKPDRQGTSFFKRLYMTRLQRRQILKWFSLAALCVLLLTVQDVMMSQIRISGATTDLAVCAIFLIGLYEGTENGSLFALIASIVYLFSGSSPGAQCIALISCTTVGLNLLRQIYWRRSSGSILLCTCTAITIYEMLNFLFGIFVGSTIWDRFGVFVLVAVFTCITALPLYPLVKLISKIGGDTWKE
ncbi:MAG: hypothetical protein E7431_05325 [Ruminococcaceae bacterium]|nr:hypothetical protein [Oscillospiraceae bacterium]